MCLGDLLRAFEKRFVFLIKKVDFQFTYTLGMDDCMAFLFKVCMKIRRKQPAPPSLRAAVAPERQGRVAAQALGGLRAFYGFGPCVGYFAQALTDQGVAVGVGGAFLHSNVAACARFVFYKHARA